MFGALWKGWKKFFSEFQKIYLEMLAVTADPLSVKNTTHQCDQIGLFLKYPCDNFSYKSSPNKWWRFKMGLLNVNTAVATFWGTVWKNWATFISASGRTAATHHHHPFTRIFQFISIDKNSQKLFVSSSEKNVELALPLPFNIIRLQSNQSHIKSSKHTLAIKQ